MRRPLGDGVPLVVKVGSSSLTARSGGIDVDAVSTVVDHVARRHEAGNPTVLVSSGAIASGLPTLGLSGRPTDIADLQVAAAVGQTVLMERYASGFDRYGLRVGQVLLTKDVLGNRAQYLNARSALTRMLDLGVVPVVNENDTVVVDEVKVGDNDQLAAITSHLVSAGMLIILTDTSGLYTDDPRFTEDAQLLRAVRHSDEVLDRLRRSSGTGTYGSGGVGTKVAAARMAAFSGIPTVIAPAGEKDVVDRVCRGEDLGTWVDPRPASLSARKLWIAFGLPSMGSITVDAGAARAVSADGRSLLGVGVRSVAGTFERGDAVEVLDESSTLIGKGISRIDARDLEDLAGRHSSEVGGEVIHRDDLVVLA